MKIQPGNVVVINEHKRIVYSGVNAHEFIRIEIMGRIGAVERDDLANNLKAWPVKPLKRHSKHEKATESMAGSAWDMIERIYNEAEDDE